MATFDIKAVFKIEGTEKFQKAFKNIQSSVDGVSKSFGSVKDAAGDVISNFVKIGVAVTGVATAIISLTAANAEAAESFENISKRSGNSVETVQTFSKIAEDAGLNAEASGKGLARFTKNMEDFKDPTSAASKELDNLSPGLRTSLLASQDADERFQILRSTLSAITDETVALNIANLTGGKAFQELLPVLQQTDKEYLSQQNRLKQLGVILTDVQNKQLANFDDALDETSTAFQGVGKQLSVVFAPALTQAAQAITEFVITNRQKLIELANVITSEVMTTVRDFFRLLSEGPEAEGVGDRAKIIFDGFVKVRDIIKETFDATIPILKTFFNVIDAVAKAMGLQNGWVLIFLQATGVVKLFFTAIIFGTALLKLLLSVIAAAPAALGVLKLAFAGAAPIIAKAIFAIQFAWLLAMEKMGAAAIIFSGVIQKAIGVLNLLKIAILANPIFLIAAAAIAIGVALGIVIEKTIGWKNILDVVVNLFKSLAEFIFSLFPALAKFFEDFETFAKEKIQTVEDFFRGLGIIIVQIFKDAFDTVVKFFEPFILKIKTGFSTAFEFIKGIIITAMNFVITTINTAITMAINTFRTIFGPAFDFIKTGIINVMNFVIQTISGAIQKMVVALKSFIDPILNGIKSFISQIAASIKSITGKGEAARKENEFKVKSAENRNSGLFGPGFASGGFVSKGPSGIDTVPAWLTKKEFVMKVDAVKKYGVGFMNAVNQGKLAVQGFANGGLVGNFLDGIGSIAASAVSPSLSQFAGAGLPPAAANSGRPLNLHLGNGGVVRASIDESTAKKLERDMRKSDLSKSSRLPGWYK